MQQGWWCCRFCLRAGQGRAECCPGSVPGCRRIHGIIPWSSPRVPSPLPWTAQPPRSFSWVSSAFSKPMGLPQVEIVTNYVSGHASVCAAWVPIGLVTSGFATGLAPSPPLRRRGERSGEGRFVGADHGVLLVLLPVPVALDTSLCLSPRPASFPDTRRCHRANPRELLETLPCTRLQIGPSWIAPS